MYYRSKSEFYFRQYVLPIFTICISIGLIFTGVYVYWASNSDNASKQNLVVAGNKPEQKEEIKQEETLALEETTIDELKALPNLELSKKGKITNIQDNGNLTFNYNEKEYILTMIGIDTNNTEKDFINYLKKDLLEKDIQVAFDVTRTDGTNMYAYIYLDENLYNEYLLESGIAKYKKEQNNTTYKSEFIQAQAYAKQLANGVWKR